MFDSKRILDQVISSGFLGGMAGGAAGAAAINALSSKKAKKYAGTALKAGGVALIGGLAYKAWRHYKDEPDNSMTTPPSEFLPESPDESNELNLLLVRAMITAARADGRIDEDENKAIMTRISEMQLDDSERAYLFEQFSTPVDVQALAREAKSEAQAAEVYAASSMIVVPPSPTEQRYLAALGTALNLPEGLREQIHRTVNEGPIAA